MTLDYTHILYRYTTKWILWRRGLKIDKKMYTKFCTFSALQPGLAGPALLLHFKRSVALV